MFHSTLCYVERPGENGESEVLLLHRVKNKTI